MNNEDKQTIKIDIACMIVFGLLAIITFIAGCRGYIHQFVIAFFCAMIFAGCFAEYINIKKTK